MATSHSALLDLLSELTDGDPREHVRRLAEHAYQELIDAEATAHIGAGPYERSEGRTTSRNGTRPRTLTTAAGDLDLAIPKLRQGSFFPSLWTPRRRVDQALYAVVMEAYVHGVSTRKVDDLVASLGGAGGIGRSEVSRICQGLDEHAAVFRNRPLDADEYPYVFLDATFCKVRVDHRVVSLKRTGFVAHAVG